MLKDIDSEIKKIDDEISLLQDKRKSLYNEKVELIQNESIKNLGKCFKQGFYAIKIIDVPKWNFDNNCRRNFNEKEYNALYVINTKKYLIDECAEKFGFDPLFFNDFFLDENNVEEISNIEFNEIFLNTITEIKEKYLYKKGKI